MRVGRCVRINQQYSRLFRLMADQPASHPPRKVLLKTKSMEKMDFSLTEDARMIGELTRRFVADELIPLERLVIEREANRGMGGDPLIPPDVEARLKARSQELGLWGIDVPERFGGHDMGALIKCVVTEQMFYSITPFTLPPDSPNLYFLSECATGDQIERYVLPYATGEKKSALALTEAGAGADAAGIRLKAERRGDKWVLNGEKMWISNARTADFMIVIAVTDREKGTRGGMTAFLVDKGTPGVTVPQEFSVIGGNFHAYAVNFDDVPLDDAQVLGAVGNAFAPLQNRLGIRRMECACWCLGYAQRALDMMIEQANTRRTFGAPLADRQAIQWWIADSYQEIEMVKLLTYRLAWQLDHASNDDKRSEIRRGASMVKVQATEMATRVIDRAIQLFGGMGVSKELPLEFMAREVRVLRIVEGPSEIHRWLIARELLRGGRPKQF
ncbi:acyl-CoA dehydrogenase family protein [Xanthobacter autotrophicus]|uniref:acyl-CoA dehydrogenase family protein n=1 Tax=Xanthobacter autotrophicus TaxID=280 RepID=UPI0032BFE582